jgi:hypothetical protein
LKVKTLDMKQLEVLYAKTSSSLVLVDGNTGHIERLGDGAESDVAQCVAAQYEDRDDAAFAVAIHTAFPVLAAEVRRLRMALEDVGTTASAALAWEKE